MTFFVISLGCAKNLVESRNLSDCLVHAGYGQTNELTEASLIIVNTCGFIADAKRESVETVLGALAEKKRTAKIVVFGCMVQRYREELERLIPEVDLFLPVMPHSELAGEIRRRFPPRGAVKPPAKPVVFTPPVYSYLKIADGCRNNCSYCAIPIIRGPLRSRSVDEIAAEAEQALAGGARELNIIAQDITAYGSDLPGRQNLEALVRRLLRIKGEFWLRLLYLYPTRISDGLVDLIAGDGRVVPYFDVPIQHVNRRILSLMNRDYGWEELEKLVSRLRSSLPGAALRTSVIVGFPTETEDEFGELLSFVRSAAFDHLGVFEYSPEEDTAAFSLKPKVPAVVRRRRRNAVMALQKDIALRRNRRMKGRTLSCLIEMPVDEYGSVWTGRIYSQAPEVDGAVYVTGYAPSLGPVVKVKIKDCKDYDLIGEVVEEGENVNVRKP